MTWRGAEARRPLIARLTGVLLAVMLTPASPVSGQITPLSVPDLPVTVPLFPLPNVAVLPFAELPLRVFEPRYREMLADALGGNRVIGIIQLQPGFEADYQGRPPIFSIGTAAVVVRADARPDGSSDIVVRAFVKFRVVEEGAGKSYRLARVEPLTEAFDEGVRVALAAERAALESALARSLGVDAGALQLPPTSDRDLVNMLVMNLDFDTVDRQVLIEQPGLLARARKLVELLAPAADPPRPR